MDPLAEYHLEDEPMLKRSALCLALLWLAGAVFAQVPTNAADVRPLLPGADAPSFEATDAYGRTFVFDPAALERPAVLIFYRGGWCPFCSLYWAELRKVEDELLALDLDLIFVSADSPAVLAEAVADTEDRPGYQLLSDASSQIAVAFGIAFQVDEATYRRYIAKSIVDLEQASGGYGHHRLPAPATFIVDRDGVIKFSYVNPDYKVRLHPEVLLAAARTMPDYRLRRN